MQDGPSPLTTEDRAALTAIATEKDDRVRLRLVTEYWRDQDRGDRAPRAIAYLHLGLLSGMCDRLLTELAKAKATIHNTKPPRSLDVVATNGGKVTTEQ